MTLNDKVQVGETTAGTSTSTSTTASQWQTYNPYRAEQGWECPRCGRINAPWVRQCDCSSSNWTITSDWTYKPTWWKEVTCQGTKTVLDSDTFKVHSDSAVYQAGGSDYRAGDTYINVSGTQANSDPNSTTTAWNTYSTNTIHTGKTNYKE